MQYVFQEGKEKLAEKEYNRKNNEHTDILVC